VSVTIIISIKQHFVVLVGIFDLDAMTHKFEIIQKEECYQGFFTLTRLHIKHTLYAGGWSEPVVRELLDRGHAVAVLLYDPLLDNVVFVEQFRVGALDDEKGAWLLELVAGMIENGETHHDVAKRECIEEAGCEISCIEEICYYYPSPGGTNEMIGLFCARVNSSSIGGIYGVEDENEDILVHVMSFEQSVAELYDGRINSASTIIAMQWLILNKDKLVQKWT